MVWWGSFVNFLSNKVYTNPRLIILGFLFSNVAPSVMIAHLSVKQVERVWFPGSTQVLVGVMVAQGTPNALAGVRFSHGMPMLFWYNITKKLLDKLIIV